MNRPAETEHRIFVCAGSNATVIIYCDCDWEKELEYEVPVDQILMEAHGRSMDGRKRIAHTHFSDARVKP